MRQYCAVFQFFMLHYISQGEFKTLNKHEVKTKEIARCDEQIIVYFNTKNFTFHKNFKYGFKGTANNSILFPNLGFFPATVFPKYSFSDAKLRFWRLVSEKNTCVGIPKGINRGTLYFMRLPFCCLEFYRLLSRFILY